MRRIRLTAYQRDELVQAWTELSEAHKRARRRVAAVLNTHHIDPETPGRLSVDPDGALVFLVSENGGDGA